MARPSPSGVTAHGGPSGPLQFDRLGSCPWPLLLIRYGPSRNAGLRAGFALFTFPFSHPYGHLPIEIDGVERQISLQRRIKSFCCGPPECRWKAATDGRTKERYESKEI